MLIADEGVYILPEAHEVEGDEVSATQARFKTAADPRQRGTETMRGVTIPVIATGGKDNNPALFSTQRILVCSLSDHTPSRFRFVGIPHGAPPPPLC